MKKWFMGLSSTMQVVVVVIAIILLFILWKRIKGFFGQIGQQQEIKGEEAALEQLGQTKTYSDKQYGDFANKLYSAMDGAGTDEDAIFSVFKKMKNDLDVLNLERKFGLRAASWAFGFSTPVDLADWLRSDLSSTDLAKLNNILSAQGITTTY